MKALNPFNLPGSPQAERQRLRRERFKVVVWTVVAANVVFFAGMLIQGCKREPKLTGTPETNSVETASSQTNVSVTVPPTPTNGPVASVAEAPGAKTEVNQALQAPAAAEPKSRSATASSVGARVKNDSANRYVVKPGDTLSRIARTHSTTIAAIKAANGLKSDRLVAGHTLRLPEPKVPVASGTHT